MRSTKFNILSIFIAVFSLFMVQGMLHPFQEFRLKYRLEIVQKSPRIRRRTCNFTAASFRLLKRMTSFSARLFFKFAEIILQQRIHQYIIALNKVFNSIKLLLMAFCRVSFNFPSSKDYWLPVHSFRF